MQLFTPKIQIKKSVWKVGDILSRLIGDINPKTQGSFGFRVRQHTDIIYGVLNCVFGIYINAMDGDRLEFEVWIMIAFDNNRKRPSVHEFYPVVLDAIDIFNEVLKKEAISKGCNLSFPSFEFSEKEIKKELIIAINDEYPRLDK